MTATRREEWVGDYPDRRPVPIDEWVGDWMSTDPVDMTGRAFQVGDWVVKACTSGRAVNLEVRRVDRVQGGKVYLGRGNKRALDFPGRCVILDSWPLASQTPGDLDPRRDAVEP